MHQLHSMLTALAMVLLSLAFTPTIAAQTVSGSGTTGNIPKWTDPNTVGDSVITESAGKIGVGTTAPGFKLEINYNNPSILGIVNTQPPSVTSGAGVSGFTTGVPTAVNQRLGFFTLGVRSGGKSYNPVAIQGFSSQPWSLGSAQGGYLRFDTTADDTITRTERMRITAGGDIGIGTPIPSERLHVEGNAWISGVGALIAVNNTDSSGNPGLYLRDASGAGRAGRISTNGGDLEFLPSGATSAPTMVVSNSGTVTINNTDSSNNPRLYLRDASGASRAGRITTNGGNIEFSPSGIPVMVVGNSGTVNTSGDLSVGGDVYARGQKIGAVPGPPGPRGFSGPPGPQGATGPRGLQGPPGPGATLSFDTITQTYDAGTGANISAPAGYSVVLATCAGTTVINGQTPRPISGGSWTHYLTPNVGSATGVRCGITGLNGSQAQAILRVARTQ